MINDKPSLQLLVIRTTEAAAEAVEALLEEKGALGSAIERRRGARLVRLQAYFPADAELPLAWVRETLSGLHENGVPVGPAEVRVIPLHEQDWAESWKRHFYAIRVTPRLWIVPTWEEVPEGAVEIVRMDPGMAFGQGDHPTTRGCLEMLERIAQDATRPSPDAEAKLGTPAVPLADVGTGTGILAIRAVQLGLGPVDAFDTEAEAIRAARGNATVNGVGEQVVFHQGGLPPHGAGPYRWIAANIFLSVLMELMPRFSRILLPDGDLVVAGLLADQEERLTSDARGRGFRVIDRICEPAEPGARRWPVLRMRRG